MQACERRRPKVTQHLPLGRTLTFTVLPADNGASHLEGHGHRDVQLGRRRLHRTRHHRRRCRPQGKRDPRGEGDGRRGHPVSLDADPQAERNAWRGRGLGASCLFHQYVLALC